jgi:hypothetical protein
MERIMKPGIRENIPEQPNTSKFEKELEATKQNKENETE